MSLAVRSVEQLPLAQLTPASRNPRTHSKRQIRQIADSIARFGFTNPILIDDDGMIIAGHGRVAAAKLLGWAEAPCLRVGAMTDAEKRAYVIADNSIALRSGWDVEILAIELQGLMDLNFDLASTGFELAEIDQILMDANEASTKTLGPEDDHLAPPTDAATVTQLGDLWVLGRHALLCGDAKDPKAVERLLGGEVADMVFTDPPYNVPITGHVSGLGRTQHREFAEASGEMSSERFTGFLTETLANAAAGCRDGAIAYVCMDWRHLKEVIAAGEVVFSELKNICVWAKTNGGMGTFYRSQHEMILAFKVGAGTHVNNFGLGDKGRYRTNVWSYPGVNTFKAERMEELASHPTVKPVALVADAIRDVSHRAQLVLDVFGGSGTTLIAAEKTGRRARLLELDPAYCDVIVRRWQKLTGKQATLAGTWNESFETVRDHRLANPTLAAEA